MIPDCVQASTAVGIGLITALAGLIEVNLVVRGEFTILQEGKISMEIVITIMAVILVAVAMHFHYKGSFVVGLVFGTLAWWCWDRSFPTNIAALPAVSFSSFDAPLDVLFSNPVKTLLFNLVFLYILTLNGLARSLSDLGELTNADGSIPRGNWLFIVCGLTTIVSGYMNGPPILISPESAAGVKSGARTGLSTLVCGILFGISSIFGPLFESVPAPGTSPLLILVGMLLFQNVGRIKWSESRDSITAFFVLLLIPFTYSIICGIGFGYVVYICTSLSTGQTLTDIKRFFKYSFNTAAVDASRSSLGHSYDPSDEEMFVGGVGNRRRLPSVPPAVLLNATGSFGDGTPSGTSSAVGTTRRRSGSLFDAIPMDLDNNIRSLMH
jgi:adenine/guanine/hypoxanthine permease